MNEITVSIIIPVYNREDTIEKCINSLLNQTLEDIEIIIVDDGSTDSTSQICLSFDDSRVKYIRKENGGASSARNLGISLATGDYIGFVDSDDYVITDYVEKLYSVCKDNDVDICIFDYDIHRNDGSISHYTDLCSEGLFNRKSVENNVLYTSLGIVDKNGNIAKYDWAVVRRWFKRELLITRKIKFDETLSNSEDCLFTFIATFYANSIYYLKNEQLYINVRNTNSVTNQYLNNYWEQRCRIIDEILSFANNSDEFWHNQSFLLFIMRCVRPSYTNISYGFGKVGLTTSIKEFKKIVNDNRVINMTENLDISQLNEDWLKIFNWTKDKKYFTLFFFYKDTYGKSRFFHFVRKIQKHFNKK